MDGLIYLAIVNGLLQYIAHQHVTATIGRRYLLPFEGIRDTFQAGARHDHTV